MKHKILLMSLALGAMVCGVNAQDDNQRPDAPRPPRFANRGPGPGADEDSGQPPRPPGGRRRLGAPNEAGGPGDMGPGPGRPPGGPGGPGPDGNGGGRGPQQLEGRPLGMGGPGGQQGPQGGPHLIPPFAMQQLDLTPEQHRKLAKLEEKVRARLENILTPEQMERLHRMGPPQRAMAMGGRQLGPNGPGNGGGPGPGMRNGPDGGGHRGAGPGYGQRPPQDDESGPGRPGPDGPGDRGQRAPRGGGRGGQPGPGGPDHGRPGGGPAGEQPPARPPQDQ